MELLKPLIQTQKNNPKCFLSTFRLTKNNKTYFYFIIENIEVTPD